MTPPAAHPQTTYRRSALIPLFVLLATALLVVGAGRADAQAYSNAQELMAAVESRPEPVTLQATMQMTLTSPSGQVLTREMRNWARGDERRLLKFTAPADIAGSGFLRIDDDRSDETLVYLPALDRIRRVAGGQRAESFFGSDFSYEDVEGINPRDYLYTLLEVREGPVYFVEATPKPEADSSYERLVLEVPEETLVPRSITYYRDGEAVKRMTVSDVQQIGDYLVPLERRMETLARGSYTVIRQSDLTLDEDLPDEVFSERFLRR